jgi:hypothetical protein
MTNVFDPAVKITVKSHPKKSSLLPNVLIAICVA